MISHFLLNLRDMPSVTTNRSDTSQSAVPRTSRGEVSSIRFADIIIGNLGESLRDSGFQEGDVNTSAGIGDGMAMGDDVEMGPMHATLLSSRETRDQNA